MIKEEGEKVKVDTQKIGDNVINVCDIFFYIHLYVTYFGYTLILTQKCYSYSYTDIELNLTLFFSKVLLFYTWWEIT